jgi:hypothetical protein
VTTQPARDRGLSAVVAVLEAAAVPYWIDSGVLLGLYRAGELLPWDKDLDLAVSAEQVDALLALVPQLEALGYRSSTHTYHGRLYAVSLQPTTRLPEGALRAAIHVYRRTGDFLWSPQTQMYVPPPAPDVSPGRRSPVGRLGTWTMDRWLYSRSDPTERQEPLSRAPDLDTLATTISRFLYQRLDQGVLAETWPLREVVGSFTWVVPVDLVLPLATIEAGGRLLHVPGRPGEYLTYRYGDWRTPVSTWCYWEDDGALVRARPTEVVPRLRGSDRN